MVMKLALLKCLFVLKTGSHSHSETRHGLRLFMVVHVGYYTMDCEKWDSRVNLNDWEDEVGANEEQSDLV